MVYIRGMMIGERIREARLRAGLTIRAMAEGLNVSPALVAHWESGIRQPDTKRLAEIADLTFTDQSVLLQDDDGNPTEPPLRQPDEIELVRIYRRLSERQRQNLLKLVRVSLNVRREIEHQSQPA